jgi:hypothetical protein
MNSATPRRPYQAAPRAAAGLAASRPVPSGHVRRTGGARVPSSGLAPLRPRAPIQPLNCIVRDVAQAEAGRLVQRSPHQRRWSLGSCCMPMASWVRDSCAGCWPVSEVPGRPGVRFPRATPALQSAPSPPPAHQSTRRHWLSWLGWVDTPPARSAPTSAPAPAATIATTIMISSRRLTRTTTTMVTPTSEDGADVIGYLRPAGRPALVWTRINVDLRRLRGEGGRRSTR